MKNTKDINAANRSLHCRVRRFIVEVHDDITPMQALYYCMKVAQEGEISGPKDRKQHCYHTTFKNGASVSCVRLGKSERFIVAHSELPNKVIT